MVKTLTLAVGAVFLLVGILGVMDTGLVGRAETALFRTNMAHDLVHILAGAAAILTALASEAAAILYLKIFGAVYGLVALLGFIMAPNGGDLLGLVTVNSADNFLHLILALGLLSMGFLLPKKAQA